MDKIAIAECMGWTRVHFCGDRLYGIFPNAEEFDSQGALENYFEIPDFLNDLNAMHIVEKKLYGGQRYRYLLNLIKVAGAPDESCLGYACATAEERVEALLKTIGK